MSGSAFYAVPVVYAPLASLGINVEVLQVVVKVDVARTQVATEQSSVGCEDGGNIDTTLLTQWQRDTSQPFVELSDNSPFLLVVDVLRRCDMSDRTGGA